MSPVHEKRLQALAKGAYKAGIDSVDFIFINTISQGNKGLISYACPKPRIPILNYPGYLINRFKQIKEAVCLDAYDTVILRYPNGDPSGESFMKEHRIITEHHSTEIPEYRSHLSEKGSLSIKFMKLVRLGLEKRYGSRILESAAGIIGVTNEIKIYELGRISRFLPSCVIPNGITVDDISFTGFKPFDGKRLDIVMMVSSMQPWQGLDRLVRSVCRYRGSVGISLHVLGNVKRENLPQDVPDLSRIRLHGYMDRKNLDDVMKDMNLAFSTLGLFRKNMEEACSLKTREYTARGIPYVLGYEDPDLHFHEDQDHFFLPVENSCLLIDMDRIIEFAMKMSRPDMRSNLSRHMRTYALANMDWSVKAEQYVRFTEQVYRVA